MVTGLNEKVDNLLNRQSELVSKYRHQNKYKVSNLMSFRCGDNIERIPLL